MNPEEVKQIVETIKTLNINFNDATTQKIAESILPVVQWYFFIQLLQNLVVFIFLICSVILSYKFLIKVVEADKEKKFRELEVEEKNNE